jgi:UDP-N-acetylmuramate dehydrogenase
MFQKQVSLKPYNSFGMDVKAERFVSVESLEDLVSVLETNPSKLLVLGGGSNLLLTEDVKGTCCAYQFKRALKFAKEITEQLWSKRRLVKTGMTLFYGL